MIGLLLARELSIALRRSGFHTLLAVQSAFALLIVFASERVVRQLSPATPPTLGTISSSVSSPPALLSSSIEVLLLVGWALWLVLACAIAVPALAGGAIARERERGTLAVVLGAGVSPNAFVAAKFASSVLLMAGLVASGVPALALAFVFGSPRVEAVAASGLVVFAWGVLIAGLALACSSVTRGASVGIASALVATGMLLVVTVVAPIAAPSLGLTPPADAYRLNPVFAVLLAEPEVGRRFVEQVASGPWLAAFTGESPLRWPGWSPFVVASLAAAGVLAAASSIVVARSANEA